MPGMFLWWINTHASTLIEVLWYLSKCPPPLNEDGSVRQYSGPLPTSPQPEITLETPPVPVKLLPRTRPALFALLIGIDNYADGKIPNLTGAVADAEDVHNYLTELGVLEENITILRNHQCTRVEIMQRIRELGTNERIQKNDPILIYFAGHGAEVDPPKHWADNVWDKKIQMILPYDFIPRKGKDNLTYGQGLLDITVSRLLSEIAAEKGDNITVIFDSCHSGSGTRNDEMDPSFAIRGFELPENYTVTEDALNGEVFSNFRKAAVAPGYAGTGMQSHVLLSACLPEQTSRENKGRGAFTLALTKTLRQFGCDEISYKELINLLPAISMQNPQCEGNNTMRTIFDSRVPNPKRELHRVKMSQNGLQYELQAGAAHGISPKSEFAVYSDEKLLEETFLGSLIASNTSSTFTTNMDLRPGCPRFRLSEPAFALQTKAGEGEDIRVHFELDQRFVNIFLRLQLEMKSNEPWKGSFKLVAQKKDSPDLIIRPKGNNAEIDITDATCVNFGLSRMPFTVGLQDTESFHRVLRGAAHFYRHLRQSAATNETIPHIKFECMKLADSGDSTKDLRRILVPEPENLNKEGVITIYVEEDAKYGFKIHNNTSCPLFASLFYFDMSSLEIVSFYQPGAARDKRAHPSIPAGGFLTVGFGSDGQAPRTFYLRDDQDIDVGFLKLFLSTEFIDYSNIPQQSPFGDAERGTGTADMTPRFWNTMQLSVVQRKGKRPTTQTLSPTQDKTGWRFFSCFRSLLGGRRA